LQVEADRKKAEDAANAKAALTNGSNGTVAAAQALYQSPTAAGKEMGNGYTDSTMRNRVYIAGAKTASSS
jgi:hypothetical protein